MDFVHFTCPYSQVRMELVLGHERVFRPPFRPTRDLAGFNTGELGMGHVVLYTADLYGAAEFYCRVLEFGVTDFAHLPNSDPFAVFLHCNSRHHSLAFMNIPGAPRRIQHVMFETVTMDDVGHSYDVCLDRGSPVRRPAAITTTGCSRSISAIRPAGISNTAGVHGLSIRRPGRPRTTHSNQVSPGAMTD